MYIIQKTKLFKKMFKDFKVLKYSYMEVDMIKCKIPCIF